MTYIPQRNCNFSTVRRSCTLLQVSKVWRKVSPAPPRKQTQHELSYFSSHKSSALNLNASSASPVRRSAVRGGGRAAVQDSTGSGFGCLEQVLNYRWHLIDGSYQESYFLKMSQLQMAVTTSHGDLTFTLRQRWGWTCSVRPASYWKPIISWSTHSRLSQPYAD